MYIPHLQLQSEMNMWDRKIKDETVNELTRAVMTTVLFVTESFQQGRALLLPQCVTVFLFSG